MADPEALVVTFDEEARAGYLYVQDNVAVARTVELSPSVHLDLAEDGSLVGVEWLGSPLDGAWCATLVECWRRAVAEGRRQATKEVDRVWCDAIDAASGSDDFSAAAALAAGVARGRKEAAADLRTALTVGSTMPKWARPNSRVKASDFAEWAARVAEGSTEP